MKKNGINEDENLKRLPSPRAMPIDHEAWLAQLNLSVFINTYYQHRDILRLGIRGKKVLIVGPGLGMDALVLRWRGFDVTTFDIDDAFHPDVVGSVHDLSMFQDQEFDVIVASHVLEHLAEPYLDTALGEISRVGKCAIIYLPVHGRHFQLRIIPGFKDIDFSIIFDVFNYFKKPDGLSPRYMAGQHYWEVGMRGFRIRDLRKRFSQFFEVLDVYRNKDWLPSQNFVLRSKFGCGDS